MRTAYTEPEAAAPLVLQDSFATNLQDNFTILRMQEPSSRPDPLLCYYVSKADLFYSEQGGLSYTFPVLSPLTFLGCYQLILQLPSPPLFDSPLKEAQQERPQKQTSFPYDSIATTGC